MSKNRGSQNHSAPATKPVHDPASSVLTGDPEADKARALLSTTKWLQALEVTRTQRVGSVENKPPGYEDWYYCFLDTRTANFDQTHQRLRTMGYIPCPESVRMVGHYHDSFTRMMMCPPETRAALQEMRKHKLRSVATGLKSVVNNHVSALQAMLGPGSTVETLHNTSGQTDVDGAKKILSGTSI